MPVFAPLSLQRFASEILSAAGATPEESRIVAASLVGANLRGYDSHGLMRLVDYAQRLQTGVVRSGVDLAVLQESPQHLAADAQWGLGQVQMHRLVERLAAKVQNQAVAAGSLRNAGHIGRLGEYCETACSHGLVSFLAVNNNGGARRVAPPGGKAPRLSTNPIALGIPHQDQPLVIDISTSATAEGKVRVKRIAQEPCPPGWLIDSDGRPTTDPNVLYAQPPGAILPLGGEQAYKGFGLALAMEILAGALSGGKCVQDGPLPPVGNCVLITLYNPARFGGREHFARQVEAVVDFVRSTPTTDPNGTIVLPGDPERRLLAEKLQSGISLDEGNWRALVELSEKLGLAAANLPAVLA